jgi:hypothetical protein
MNILQTEDLVKGLPDERLMQEAQSPSGQVPQFLLISEVQRRADMRKRYQADQAEQPQGTVTDQILNQGIMGTQPPIQQPPPGQGMPPPNMPQQLPQGQQASFADAKQSYEQDRQARQQQYGMQLNADQGNQNAQLGLQQNQLGYQQNQLGAANQLAGYGTQQFADQMEKLGIMQGIGAQQRQLVQTGLDTGYQDFMQQQSFPWEQVNMMNSIIHGGAIAPGGTSAMFGPQPSNTQNLLGSGIAAAGMYGQGKGGQ